LAFLVATTGCGKLFDNGGDPDSGDAHAGWGTACLDDSGFTSPPTCVDDAGGIDCAEWGATVAEGGGGGCGSGGTCVFQMPWKSCTPGASGDEDCQKWLQGFSKSAKVYAKCFPPEKNGAHNFAQCVAASTCTQVSDSYTRCTCGSDPINVITSYCDQPGKLCVDVGGQPACGSWCQ
jgi:hypothetical protein